MGIKTDPVSELNVRSTTIRPINYRNKTNLFNIRSNWSRSIPGRVRAVRLSDWTEETLILGNPGIFTGGFSAAVWIRVPGLVGITGRAWTATLSSWRNLSEGQLAGWADGPSIPRNVGRL